jgi:hypothetical protein
MPVEGVSSRSVFRRCAMRFLVSRVGPLVAVSLLSGVVLAQSRDIPLTNWTVPPYHPAGSAGGLRTMSDVTPGIAFVGVTPCRIVDTRLGFGFTGPYGPPSLVAGPSRTFDLNSGPCPGLPNGLDAYSLNVTVVNTSAPGHLVIWPTGGAQPNVSSINFVAGQTIANAVIVPAGTNGSVNVAAAAATDVLIDVNGYFTDTYNPGVQLLSIADLAGGGAILGVNVSTASGSHGVGGFVPGPGFVHGVQGQVGPAAQGTSSGVHGINDSTSPGGVGVLGEITSTSPGVDMAGVWGLNAGTGTNGFGVRGSHVGSGTGVYGLVNGTQSGARGVFGYASGNFGNTFGVKGQTASTSPDSAGVKGVSGWGDPLGDNLDCVPCFPAGVRGVDNRADGSGVGVLAISRGKAVAGVLLATTGTAYEAVGHLGSRFGDDPDITPDPVWAVFGQGDIGATGTKYFVEPHPSNPTLTIRYVALEAAEAGTYFRGRGKFQNGLATIEVPEDFRLVTDSEGLSIQVTPIGEMATVAVLRIGLDRIVVKGSRNVEFFYTVNGVRRTFKDSKPIAKGYEFVPEKPDATIPLYLSEEQKRSLIANGTYNADGTVNMETAKKLGWDKTWEKRNRPALQPEAKP